MEPFVAASAARALGEAFPHVRVFRYPAGWGLHFLASMQPIRHAPAAELAGRMPPRAALDLVEWGPASTAEDQFRSLLEGEIPLGRVIDLSPTAPTLRDDRPVNEYFVIRRMFPNVSG
jgi:hypothetical protein